MHIYSDMIKHTDKRFRMLFTFFKLHLGTFVFYFFYTPYRSWSASEGMY